jgi:succinyl-diaminopimelate desuccinylase
MNRKARIESYFADREDELAAAVSRLVRHPSFQGAAEEGKPFGSAVYAALEDAVALAGEWGLSAENCGGYVGTASLNDAPDTLHMLAHLDVVPPGKGWTVTDAFAPKRAGDLLFGRGAADDKGPLVAALMALRAAKELARAWDIPWTANAKLIMGCDEESGFADIRWYYARHAYAPHTFAPDSEFPVTNAEKGHLQPVLRKSWDRETAPRRVTFLRASAAVNVVPAEAVCHVTGFTAEEIAAYFPPGDSPLGYTVQEEGAGLLSLRVEGRGTHASTPEAGENALTGLLTLLAALPLSDCTGTRVLRGLAGKFPHGDHFADTLGIRQADGIAGALTITLTVCDLTETGITARFDCRTPLCATEASVVTPLAAQMTALGLSFEGELDPAHYTPPDSPFVQTLLGAYTRYTGEDGRCLSSGGGTYVHGIPGGVAFGCLMPGFDCHMHGADERVSLSALLTSCKIFTQVILDLCTEPQHGG